MSVTSRFWEIRVTATGTVSELWRVESDEPITADEARRVLEEDDTSKARVVCLDSVTEDERDRQYAEPYMARPEKP